MYQAQSFGRGLLEETKNADTEPTLFCQNIVLGGNYGEVLGGGDSTISYLSGNVP